MSEGWKVGDRFVCVQVGSGPSLLAGRRGVVLELRSDHLLTVQLDDHHDPDVLHPRALRKLDAVELIGELE